VSLTYIPVALRRLVEERANRCNRHKGSDLGSFDPQTGAFSFLFNPRTQQWDKHFKFEELQIVGLTPEGGTTARLLQLNSDERLAERQRRRDCS
jgi:hypothetical protein